MVKKKSHKKNSNKTPGKNDEFAWNADFLWQLLRRSKSYQRAVKHFYDQLDAANSSDAAILEFSEQTLTLSVLDRMYDETILRKKWDHEKADAERKQLLQKRVSTEDDDDQYAVNESLIYKHEFSSDAISSCIDPEHPALQDFLSKFGDIIRFPLFFEIDNPHPDLLLIFWNLRPAGIVDSLHIDVINKERSKWNYGPYFTYNHPLHLGRPSPSENPLFRLVHFNVEINTHFDKDTVIKHFTDAMVKAVDELYVGDGHDDGALRGRDANVERFSGERFLKAAELYEENRSGTKLSSVEIGRILCSEESLNVSALRGEAYLQAEKWKSIGTASINSVKMYMDFFNRDD